MSSVREYIRPADNHSKFSALFQECHGGLGSYRTFRVKILTFSFQPSHRQHFHPQKELVSKASNSERKKERAKVRFFLLDWISDGEIQDISQMPLKNHRTVTLEVWNKNVHLKPFLRWWWLPLISNSWVWVFTLQKSILGGTGKMQFQSHWLLMEVVPLPKYWAWDSFSYIYNNNSIY